MASDSRVTASPRAVVSVPANGCKSQDLDLENRHQVTSPGAGNPWSVVGVHFTDVSFVAVRRHRESPVEQLQSHGEQPGAADRAPRCSSIIKDSVAAAYVAGVSSHISPTAHVTPRRSR